MSDWYSRYEQAVEELLVRIDKNHPLYSDLLTFQSRLKENIYQARRHGDTENLRATRSQILEQLDITSEKTIGCSFQELSQMVASEKQSPYPNFWQRFEIKEKVSYLRIITARYKGHIAVWLLGTAILIALFAFFVIPSSRSIEWVPAIPPDDTEISPISDTEKGNLVLRREPNQDVFTQTMLLSADAHPTSIGVDSGERGKIYAGTYGAGLYASDGSSGEWDLLGLRDSIVTEIVVDSNAPGTILASTNIGVLATKDDGINWEDKGPVNDLITALARNPLDSDGFLAGTTYGVYRSEDGGETWIGPSLATEVVTSIRFVPSEPNRVYLSCLLGAIYRSDDGGKTWFLFRPPDGEGSTPIAVDPNAPDIVYAGPSDYGLYRSIDGGETWEYLGLNGISISSIVVSAFQEQTIFVGSDNGYGLSVSWDGGSTWQNYGLLRDNIIDIVEDPTNPGVVIVTTSRHGLLLTRDGGRSWSEMGLERPSLELEFPIGHIAAVSRDGSHLFAVPGNESGLFESLDGGASWSPVAGIADLMGSQIKRIYFSRIDDQDRLIASSQGGAIFCSEDYGVSWYDITLNIPRGGFAPIAVAEDGTLFAGPANRGVWKRPPGSDGWMTTNLGTHSIKELWVNPSGRKIYALDETSILHVSLNGGNSWFDTSISLLSVAVGSEDHLVGISETSDLSESLNIVISEDSGQSWRVSNTIETGAYFDVIRVVASKDQPEMYYLVNGSLAKHSKDHGKTWREVSLPESGVPYWISDSRMILSGRKNLYTSTDTGKTWTTVRYRTSIWEFTAFGQLDSKTHLAGTQYDGLLLSRDGGKTWQQTSIGAGYEILALWVNQAVNPPQTITLFEGSSVVSLATTKNTRAWEQIQTPCQNIGMYFQTIQSREGPIWQMQCVDPHALFILKPSISLDWIQVRLPENVRSFKDVVILEDGSIYLMISQGWPHTYRIWMTSDHGENWEIVTAIPRDEGWELSNDVRADSVLIRRTGGIVAAGYRPKIITPLASYVALGFYLIIYGFLVFKTSSLQNSLRDLRQVSRWIFISSDMDVEDEFSPIFLWVICPGLFLTALVLLQMLPADSYLPMFLNNLEANSLLVAAGVRLLDYLPFEFLTPVTASFSSISFVLWAFLGLITSLIAVSVGILKIQSLPSSWQMTWKRSSALLSSVLLIFVIMGALLTSISEYRGVAFYFIQTAFIILVFYKAIAVSLNAIGKKFKISRNKLAVIYSILALPISVIAALLVRSFENILPNRFAEVALEIPFVYSGILNTLLMIFYLVRNRLEDFVAILGREPS